MYISPLNRLGPLGGGVKELFFNNCGYIYSTDGDLVIVNKYTAQYLSGNSYALNIKFQRSAIGTKQALFASSDNSLAIYLTAANEIQISHYDTTVEKLATTTATFTSTSIDYYLSVVFDTATPANSKIIVNGVDEALSENTLTSTIDVTTNDYYLGSNGTTLYLEGTINQFSINSATETLSQNIDWFKNLANPASIFGNIVKLLNTDTDPLYDRVNSTFGAIDNINTVVSKKVFHCDATNFGLQVDDNTYLNNIIASAFTVNLLVKFGSVTSGKYVYSKVTDAGAVSFAIGRNGDDFRMLVFQSTVQKVVIAADLITAGEWYFISAVFDGASSTIYVDGVDVSTFNNVTTQPDANDGDYHTGRPPATLTTFDGEIAFLEIADKAIDSTEALEVDNSGNPLSISQTSFSSNLKYTFKAEDLIYQGKVFDDTDSVSGLKIESMQAGSETDLFLGGPHMATSRNFTEFDKECNGVVSKGQIIDRVFWRGQSNSLGVEPNASLPVEYEGSRNDIKNWDGVSAYVNLTVPSTYGGQFSFVNKWINNTDRDVYLDQFSISGTALALTGGTDWNTASVGEYFDLAKAQNDLADTALVNNNVNLVAEVWNQHENDCTTEVQADAYQVNLTNYINKRRISYPNLKFVIILVHTDLPIGSFPFKATVKAAQISVAAALTNVVTIDQDSFGSAVDNIHRNAAGYEALGNAIFNLLK